MSTTKVCTAQVKAAGEADGLADGQFSAYASVFGTKDSYGDIVLPGAFAESLAEWKESGAPIPLYWSHGMHDVENLIGEVLEASEDDHGLLVTAQLDIVESAKAAAVYRHLKGRRIRQMSFAYDVLDAEMTDTAYELRKLRLHEVSVVQIGANQDTEILAVKTAADHLAKAGKVISSKNLDSLVSARDSIDAVIKAASADDEQAKASGNRPAATEEPQGAKAVEPSDSPSAKTLSAQLSILALEGAHQ